MTRRATPTGPMAAAPVQGAEPADVRAYVEMLESWTGIRAEELLSLDELAGVSDSDADRLDVSVAFMSWRAIEAREEQLTALLAPVTPGRDQSVVDEAATLIGQPLHHTDGTVIAADLSEACAVVDALINSVRSSLGRANDDFERAAALRAAARSDLAIAGGLAGSLGEQVRHIAELATRLQRLDLDLDALERLAVDCAEARTSLEISDAERLDLTGRVHRAVSQMAELRVRESDIRELATRCRDRIATAPNLAIPSVDVLGPPPDLPTPSATGPVAPWPALRSQVSEWLVTFDRLGAALDLAQQRFAEPLRERDELRGVLHGFRAKAAASGIAESEHIGNLYENARAQLWSAPCDLDLARAATRSYIDAINLVLSGKV